MQDLEGVLRALAVLMLDQEPCRIKLLEAKALPAVVAALGAPPLLCVRGLRPSILRARADRTDRVSKHLQFRSSQLAFSGYPRVCHLLTGSLVLAWCCRKRSVPSQPRAGQHHLIQLVADVAVMTGHQSRLPAGGAHSQRVQAAAADCVRALSRSARNIRMMLCNARIAEPLVAMLAGGDSQAAVSACAALCNLVLDFSPFKVRRQCPL